MRLVLLLALLVPAAALSWLLEAEHDVGSMLEARRVAAPRPPATLAPGAVVRPGPVAVRERGVSVSGHVLGVDGRPEANARVLSIDDEGVVVDSAGTDASGGFRLANACWDGPLVIDAGARGRARVWIEEEDRHGLRIALIPAAWLRGRVLAPDGCSPVAHARVRIESHGFGECATRSSADGTFELLVPREQEFFLLADGGEKGRRRLYGLGWAADTGLNVMLERVRVLTGRVVTESEEGSLVGVPGVVVHVWESGAPHTPDGVSAEDGTFRIFPRGCSGTVEVLSTAWVLVGEKPSLEGRREIELRVKPRITLRGRCVREDGTVVAGAEITSSERWVAALACSDARGCFALPCVGVSVPGVTISARIGAYVGCLSLEKMPAPGDEHTIVLHPTHAVFGRVLDARGQPAAYVSVCIDHHTDFGTPSEDRLFECVVTAANGRFVAADLGNGPCQVTIEANGLESPVVDARPAIGGTDLGDIRLRRLPRLLGRLVDPSGAPIVAGSVRLEASLNRGAPCAPDGTFACAVPRAAQARVVFAAPGYVTRAIARAELPAEGLWTVVLQPSPVIAGRLLAPAGCSLLDTYLTVKSATSDEVQGSHVDLGGRFRVELPAEGTYHVCVHSIELAFRTAMHVRSGTRDLVIEGRRLPWITGRLVGPSGLGIAGARVSAFWSDLRRQQGRSCVTDVDGEFALEGLPGTAHRVRVTGLPEGLGVRTGCDVPVGTDDLVLEAEETLSIAGRIHGVVDGLPGTFGVEASPVEHSAGPGRFTLQPDGAFVVDRLLPGLYEVHAWRCEARQRKVRGEPVRVYAGTEELHLVLPGEEEWGSPADEESWVDGESLGERADVRMAEPAFAPQELRAE